VGGQVVDDRTDVLCFHRGLRRLVRDRLGISVEDRLPDAARRRTHHIPESSDLGHH
jgi:hypothetical protein